MLRPDAPACSQQQLQTSSCKKKGVILHVCLTVSVEYGGSLQLAERKTFETLNIVNMVVHSGSPRVARVSV